jgi:V8-like Glu-specific endopeptidase
MTKLIIYFGLLSFNLSWAGLKPVTQNEVQNIQELASGVCSIGENAGTNCCSGFKISHNLIMTNFHCLSCANKVYNEIVKNTPFMMEPETYLYSLAQGGERMLNFIKEKIRKNPDTQIDPDKFFIPKNDDELTKLMNVYSEFYNFVNFKNQIDIPFGDISKSKIKIKKIHYLNKQNDFAIIETEELSLDFFQFKLLEYRPLVGEKLITIGHPHKSDYPNKKMYDAAENCQITQLNFSATYGDRKNVLVHHCETNFGSSGSPLIQKNTSEVIGIHWGSDTKNKSFGIEMNSIVNKIKVSIPQIYEQIQNL